MCRLLAYLGSPVTLEDILYKPEHSLIVQSYQPLEMTSGVVNADGFGVGWYHSQKNTDPFTYRNTLPIWNDLNLADLSRYVESKCVLAYVRSATPGQALDFANCQPFNHQQQLFIHNGYIENFRKTLHREIRSKLTDDFYEKINGITDSEHIFALLLSQSQINQDQSPEDALGHTLLTLLEMAKRHQVKVSANIVFSDGNRLIASRFSSNAPAPSLYWLKDHLNFPKSVIIASEPLFTGNWSACPENSIISVGEDCDIQIKPI
ncbi:MULTISPECIES: ergothioneine biosynthesis protein EgtC [unclassified Nodularia (in: cyanobacteria)]|uniref:ergothioneine biosynthesis protein EgtC n=1 Tax=unclassified Nodularia (in: cyanobacteria) TaxID=2656917 RepID=UPI0018828D5B|nr:MULTISPECIES: ergothioneine biosynthesis protein EgtC [unclassified Nodularia (in: cyanobacteria)]MBE9199807.1 ergothioneine biosynthesis protein EgtC [Nodularia sp. LEGE 06071]MCC2692788.1 ergothioneine biosynthesis protein EgtC [Nodularia sp. LEGE 04288]